MDVGAAPLLERRASFGPDELSAVRARRFVRDSLHGVIGTGLWEEAVLVASELATNAILHARTPFEVVVTVGTCVRLEVADGSTDLPMPRLHLHDAADRQEGRGLYVVAELARSWGVVPEPGGKRVWAELDF